MAERKSECPTQNKAVFLSKSSLSSFLRLVVGIFLLLAGILPTRYGSGVKGEVKLKARDSPKIPVHMPRP